jgi:hypothetical protein
MPGLAILLFATKKTQLALDKNVNGEYVNIGTE